MNNDFGPNSIPDEEAIENHFVVNRGTQLGCLMGLFCTQSSKFSVH